MPSAVVTELPKTASPGNGAAAMFSKRTSRSTEVAPSAFRQQFTEVASRNAENRGEKDAAVDKGRSSRAARSEPASRGEKPASRKQRDGESTDEIDESDVTDRADEKSGDEECNDATPVDGLIDIDSLAATEARTDEGDPAASKADMVESTIDPQTLAGVIATANPSQPVSETGSITGNATVTPADAATTSVDDDTNAALANQTLAVATVGPAQPKGIATTTNPYDAATETATANPVRPTVGVEKKSAGVSALGVRPAGENSSAGRASADDSDSADNAFSNPSGSVGATGSMTSSGVPGLSAAPGLSAISQFAEAFSPEATSSDHAGAVGKPSVAPDISTASANTGISLNAPNKGPSSLTSLDAAGAPATPEAPNEARFAAVNHAKIASEVRGTLLPNGGKMELRLDPPELGALQVSLHIKDGVVTASFQTQNPDAARLLSHTMADLRQSLEAQGVVVDKLHVQQAPKDESAGNNPNNSDRQNLTQEQQKEDRREQQRKDMVQRLWDQLAGNAPIDVRA